MCVQCEKVQELVAERRASQARAHEARQRALQALDDPSLFTVTPYDRGREFGYDEARDDLLNHLEAIFAPVDEDDGVRIRVEEER